MSEMQKNKNKKTQKKQQQQQLINLHQGLAVSSTINEFSWCHPFTLEPSETGIQCHA